eukprot:gene29496-biopygen5410
MQELDDEIQELNRIYSPQQEAQGAGARSRIDEQEVQLAGARSRNDEQEVQLAVARSRIDEQEAQLAVARSRNDKQEKQLAEAWSMNYELEGDLAAARSRNGELEVHMACMTGEEDVLASQNVETLEHLLHIVSMGPLQVRNALCGSVEGGRHYKNPLYVTKL